MTRDDRDRTGSLTKEMREDIIDWYLKGFEPKEMSRKFSREYDNITVRAQTVEQFLDKDRVQEKIETEKAIKEKESEYSQKELIRDLKKVKEEMWSYLREMKEEGHGVTANEATKNLLKATKQLGDYLDAFDNDSMDANVVKINELNINNISHVVKKMPVEQKKSIVKQLQDDPEVESFMIEQVEESDKATETERTATSGS